jgi:hypothetical protein
MIMPSEQEFMDWLAHPVTRVMRQALSARRESYRQQWEGGSISELSMAGYAILNAAAVGECKGLAFAQELDYEDLKGELENEYKRVDPEGSSSAA